MSQPGTGGELRKAEDFREAIESRGEEAVRRELGVPDVDEILKELQQRHGIRISPSRKLVERLEGIKKESGYEGYDPVPASGCVQTDVCVLCDHGDICSTCDTMDWCIFNDTHIVPAE